MPVSRVSSQPHYIFWLTVSPQILVLPGSIPPYNIFSCVKNGFCRTIPAHFELPIIFNLHIHCNFHTTQLPTSFAYILHYCLNSILIDEQAILQIYPFSLAINIRIYEDGGFLFK